MRVFRFLMIICVLPLASPALLAQTAAELLNWTKTHLDRGNCEYAKETYALYKEKVPQGNAEVERRIAECGKVARKKQNLTFTVNGASFEMVYVEAGTFIMGCTSEQGSDTSVIEKPAHLVNITKDYYIGKFEVTQALWQTVMGNNPSRFKGDSLPVEQVSWYDAQEFCAELSRMTGHRFSLPTEAEWEYAARGGKKSTKAKYSGSSGVSNVAWYKDNSGEQTHPVGRLHPNELGIYDMSGNVYEMCLDWYGRYSSVSQTDPKGSGSGDEGVVVRGGSWYGSAYPCRISYRCGIVPDGGDRGIGFRVVLRNSMNEMVKDIGEGKKVVKQEEFEKHVVLEHIESVVIVMDANDKLSDLTSRGLDKAAEFMKHHPDFNVLITGHTDNTGTEENNQARSERYARIAADYLVEKGVERSRITCKGYGASRPIDTNDTFEGRLHNCRVEFTIIRNNRNLKVNF